MPPKPILVCTVGLPRSGKTTWAREQRCPIVCPDAIRLALYGRAFEPLAEAFVWAIAKCMVRALFLAGHPMVILDATNNSQKRRREWLDDDWATYWKVFETDLKTCLQRAKETNRAELLPVIERMAEESEELDSSESMCLWKD